MDRYRIKFFPIALILSAILLTFQPLDSIAATYGWSGLADFGRVTDFGLFLSGDLVFSNSDIEGRAAVGGNARLESFSIGVKASHSDYSLVTGGDLYAGGPQDSRGGQVNNGGILAGGSAELERVGVPSGDVRSAGNLKLNDLTIENGSAESNRDITVNSSYVSGTVISGHDITMKNSTTGAAAASNTVILRESAVLGKVEAGKNIEAVDSGIEGDAIAGTQVILEGSGVSGDIKAPADIREAVLHHQEIPQFDFASIDLRSLSDSLWQQTMSLINLEAGQDIVLNAGSGTNFYRILADQLMAVSGLVINAPADSIVVINVEGGSEITMHDKALRVSGGIAKANVIYNFHDSEEMDLRHLSVSGSFLAPDAHLAFYDSVLEGILMAKSLYGGEADPFDGLLHSVQINEPVESVPLPGTIILLFVGVAILFTVKQIMHSHCST